MLSWAVRTQLKLTLPKFSRGTDKDPIQFCNAVQKQVCEVQDLDGQVNRSRQYQQRPLKSNSILTATLIDIKASHIFVAQLVAAEDIELQTRTMQRAMQGQWNFVECVGSGLPDLSPCGDVAVYGHCAGPAVTQTGIYD
ncbi:hypothetical protein PR048_011028 [Dryococelus australis]|uniref:Uncharacterized protein n=1 Tax=Dryococelus australis TaxID=614101 RepID=A0ABQ9HKH1_9NEOP|nr:hypothetical protein PR048_011028 [Dryococelus australis]